MTIRWTALLTLLAGCAMSHGPVGVIAPSADVVGTKLLRPGAAARSCRSRILGIPFRPGDPELREALGQIMALDAEGDVVVNADVRSSAVLTGVYNRWCVEVRGDLARSIPTIAIPAPTSHSRHQGHH